MTEHPETQKEIYELSVKQIDLEKTNELRDKLKKAKTRHEAYALCVSLTGFLLFQLVLRFPNIDWSFVGILWFMFAIALGFIMR